jgi:hypothetical protein
MTEDKFRPYETPEARGGVVPPPNVSDRRTAHAAEYSARQLEEINQKLGRLIEAIERLATRMGAAA